MLAQVRSEATDAPLDPIVVDGMQLVEHSPQAPRLGAAEVALSLLCAHQLPLAALRQAETLGS